MRTHSDPIYKAPGADLKVYRPLYLRLGAITSLLFFILLFRVNLKFEESDVVFAIAEQEVVTLEDIIQTKQQETPPPPPRPSAPVAVANDAVISDELLEFDFELNFDEAPLPAPPPPPTAATEAEEDEEVFIVVERMPELIGGLEGLQSRIVYPEIARMAGIEGRVIVQFVIDARGNVLNPVVVRGIGAGCDEVALEAVKSARFTPGMQRGRPVRVSYTLPVTFRLSTGEKNR